MKLIRAYLGTHPITVGYLGTRRIPLIYYFIFNAFEVVGLNIQQLHLAAATPNALDFNTNDLISNNIQLDTKTRVNALNNIELNTTNGNSVQLNLGITLTKGINIIEFSTLKLNLNLILGNQLINYNNVLNNGSIVFQAPQSSILDNNNFILSNHNVEFLAPDASKFLYINNALNTAVFNLKIPQGNLLSIPSAVFNNLDFSMRIPDGQTFLYRETPNTTNILDLKIPFGKTFNYNENGLSVIKNNLITCASEKIISLDSILSYINNQVNIVNKETIVQFYNLDIALNNINLSTKNKTELNSFVLEGISSCKEILSLQIAQYLLSLICNVVSQGTISVSLIDKRNMLLIASPSMENDEMIITLWDHWYEVDNTDLYIYKSYSNFLPLVEENILDLTWE